MEQAIGLFVLAFGVYSAWVMNRADASRLAQAGAPSSAWFTRRSGLAILAVTAIGSAVLLFTVGAAWFGIALSFGLSLYSIAYSLQWS